MCADCAESLSAGPTRVDDQCEGVHVLDPATGEFASAFPVWALGEYADPLRALVIDFKNGGHFALARTWIPLLSDAIASEVSRCRHRHVIVSAPSRAQAVRRRGEDHMALVADGVSTTLAVARAPRLTLTGHSQSASHRKERYAGGRRRIRAERDHEWAEFGGARAIILDDVATTGGTLMKVSEALRGLGVDTCAAFTIAAAGFSRRAGATSVQL